MAVVPRHIADDKVVDKTYVWDLSVRPHLVVVAHCNFIIIMNPFAGMFHQSSMIGLAIFLV